MSGGRVAVACSEETTFVKLRVRAKVRICCVSARKINLAVEPNHVPVHSVSYTNNLLSVTQENAVDLEQRG
jgi:hypothetical protein